jgi:hypothetical protein
LVLVQYRAEAGAGDGRFPSAVGTRAQAVTVRAGCECLAAAKAACSHVGAGYTTSNCRTVTSRAKYK